MHPAGQTRTRVTVDHAVIGADSHVESPIHGWTDARGVMLVSPAMGSATAASATRGPGFAMYQIDLTPQSRLIVDERSPQRLLYVLRGKLRVDDQTLAPEHYAYLPPGDQARVSGQDDCRVLVFEKNYVSLPDVDPPSRRTGRVADVAADPFMGDPSARLAKLLPETPAFDMAVNVFTFDPGTPLPLVETHIMEHGLFMTAGQGIYRLGQDWYPVGQGDAIWMAAYCPQWFVAMGKQPAQYIYYKDIHRNHLP